MIKVEKAKNNFTIEMRIFENYEKVKYEIRNGRRLIGKGRVKEILDILLWDECQGCFILWLLCVWCGISWHASNTRYQNFLVLKMCICLQGTP